MWIIETESDRQKRQEAQAEQLKRMMREASDKSRAREAWLKTHTCEHCGQHPPLPPYYY